MYGEHAEMPNIYGTNDSLLFGSRHGGAVDIYATNPAAAAPPRALSSNGLAPSSFGLKAPAAIAQQLRPVVPTSSGQPVATVQPGTLVGYRQSPPMVYNRSPTYAEGYLQQGYAFAPRHLEPYYDLPPRRQVEETGPGRSGPSGLPAKTLEFSPTRPKVQRCPPPSQKEEDDDDSDSDESEPILAKEKKSVQRSAAPGSGAATSITSKVVKAPAPQIVERIVEKEVLVDKVIEVEIPKDVEVIVEVEKPVERIVEKIIEVHKEVPKVVTVEVPYEKIVYVEKPVVKTVYQDVPVHMNVPNERVVYKEVLQPVEVIREVAVPMERTHIEEKLVPTDQPFQKGRGRVIGEAFQPSSMTLDHRAVGTWTATMPAGHHVHHSAHLPVRRLAGKTP
eukprot:Tamp_05446.p1 GENE.Tamp_05446~~Tamp_05446.p1  ORF type:complete len:391 (+),score=54.58 Tamp_05446:122-1294(+)